MFVPSNAKKKQLKTAPERNALSVEKAEFMRRREMIGATDGHLGAQLLKPEQAGYLIVEKKFVLRKQHLLSYDRNRP